MARRFRGCGGPCAAGRTTAAAAVSRPAWSSFTSKAAHACPCAFRRVRCCTRPTRSITPFASAGLATGRVTSLSAGGGRTGSGGSCGPFGRFRAAIQPTFKGSARPPTPAFAFAITAPRTPRFSGRANRGRGRGPSIGATTTARPAASTAPTPGANFPTQTTPSPGRVCSATSGAGSYAGENARSKAPRIYIPPGALIAGGPVGASCPTTGISGGVAGRFSAPSRAVGSRWSASLTRSSSTAVYDGAGGPTAAAARGTCPRGCRAVYCISLVRNKRGLHQTPLPQHRGPSRLSATSAVSARTSPQYGFRPGSKRPAWRTEWSGTFYWHAISSFRSSVSKPSSISSTHRCFCRYGHLRSRKSSNH